MVKFTNEIAKRCARWILLETSPAPLPMLHPVRDDMAAAADEIDRLQKLIPNEPQVPPRGNYEDRHPTDDILWSASDHKDFIEVVEVLGIQESFQTPAEAVRELHAEIERLRVLPQESLVSELADVAEAHFLPVEEAARFLLDRLQEFDPGDFQAERDFHGHVAPAIARLRSALSRPQQASDSASDASTPDQFRNG